MDLLQNAVESIRVGVEDYETDEHPRLLAAVRSLYAGILLLYKEALRRLSPPGSQDVLIKQNVLPVRSSDGTVSFVGSGKKTVDAWQIQDRFAGLGLTTDWTRFKRVADVRNNVEHYFANINKAALASVVSDAFLLTRDFISTHLDGDPCALLGEDTWQAMLQVSQVYKAEKADCEAKLEAIEWTTAALSEGVGKLSCTACPSDLLAPESTPGEFPEVYLVCRACGEREAPDDYVPRAIEAALGWQSYVAMTDGGDEPVATCPECGEDTYVVEEQQCALCENSAEHICALCSSTIPPSELATSPLCGWCANTMSKDD